MEIHEGIANFPKLSFPVVTSGTFDGVHVGHRQILKRLREAADRRNGQTVLLTFWPHPRLVLQPNNWSLKLLSTFEEKAEILADLGVDHLVKIHFTHEFAQLSSEEFIQDVLIKALGTKMLVIGYDHHFGKNREGSFEHLQQNSDKYGFELEEIPAQEIDDIAVSSTKIRNALTNGQIEEASRFLERNYSFRGVVLRGDQLGRILGFPTANMHIAEGYKAIPAEGIYAVNVLHEGQNYGGMLYIGTRPTLNKTERSIEVNIFDFDKEIYGDKLTIALQAHIRNDVRFANLELLKNQLEKDREVALKILNR